MAALALGCAGPGTPDPGFALLGRRAQVPAGLEDRLAPIDPYAVARVGDSVLAHVVAETGKGLVERFVRLTVAGTLSEEGLPEADIQFATGATNARGEPLQTTSTRYARKDDSYIHTFSTSGLVRVEVFDASGTQLATRNVGVRLLACTGTEGPANVMTLWPGLSPLLELILATPELDALLMDVAKRPPLWTLLNGLTLTLDLGLDEAQDIGGGLVQHPATIKADGYLALEGSVIQGPKSFPFLLTAGIQRLEAAHPTREDRRASIEIVAGTRGSGPVLMNGASGPFPAPDQNGRIPGYEPSPPVLPSKIPGAPATMRESISGTFSGAPD